MVFITVLLLTVLVGKKNTGSNGVKPMECVFALSLKNENSLYRVFVVLLWLGCLCCVLELIQWYKLSYNRFKGRNYWYFNT